MWIFEGHSWVPDTVYLHMLCMYEHREEKYYSSELLFIEDTKWMIIFFPSWGIIVAAVVGIQFDFHIINLTFKYYLIICMQVEKG